MSGGVPYPHPNPVPGSNAIGAFVIGVSQIGDIPAFDVWTTVISQYGNSPIITQLCSNMAQYLDQTKNMSDFYDQIWDIDVAVGYGLDVWGRILGISRTLQLPGPPAAFLGFEEAGQPTTRTPFGQAPFFSGQTLTNNFTLSDSAYRVLLLAKALANVCDGSIPAINQLLLNLFPNLGKCYVADGALAMAYTFDFVLSPVQLAIVQNSGVLPRTSGVASSVVQP